MTSDTTTTSADTTSTTAAGTTDNRDCLVCGHGTAEHGAVEGRCTGTDGLCQCHGYNPDQHPVERLAARREAGARSTD